MSLKAIRQFKKYFSIIIPNCIFINRCIFSFGYIRILYIFLGNIDSYFPIIGI